MSDIETSVFSPNPKKKMPPSNPLTTAQLDFLKRWMEAGAPEGELPPPPPPPEELKPTFASISKLLFTPLCFTCHSPNGTAFLTPLDNLTELIEGARPMIVPGKPDDSKLMKSLIRTDKKKMPPLDSGVRELTPGEISTVRQWIAEGANP